MGAHLGFAAIEFLATTAIIVPALITLTLLISRGTTLVSTTRKFALQAHLDITLEQIVDRVIKDLDSHPLPLLPRTHHEGFITFTDGTPNQIHALRNGRAPGADTTPITYLSVDTKRTLLRKAIDADGPTPLLRLCARYDQELVPTDYQSFLAISGDGVFEVLATLRRISSSSCWHAQLSSTRSMITDQSTAIATTDLLIPIREIYTYYKDQNDILRILSHKGDRNIENQPLLDSVGALAFELQSDPLLGLSQISSVYSRLDAPLHRTFNTNRIGRHSHLPFSLNRP